MVPRPPRTAVPGCEPLEDSKLDEKEHSTTICSIGLMEPSLLVAQRNISAVRDNAHFPNQLGKGLLKNLNCVHTCKHFAKSSVYYKSAKLDVHVAVMFVCGLLTWFVATSPSYVQQVIAAFAAMLCGTI